MGRAKTYFTAVNKKLLLKAIKTAASIIELNKKHWGFFSFYRFQLWFLLKVVAGRKKKFGVCSQQLPTPRPE
jgi:hypothetical protein